MTSVVSDRPTDDLDEIQQLWVTHAIEFSASATVDLHVYRAHIDSMNEEWVFDDDEIARFAHEALLDELARAVHMAFLALTLSKPVAAAADTMYKRIRGRLVRTASGFHAPDDAVRRAVELGWPPISSPPIEDAWRWVGRIPGWPTGRPSTSAGRALAAFSHVISSRDPVKALVWSLCGLEVLYCVGTTGLQRQLFDKAQVVLGPLTAFKRQYRSIYATRSRFVHGNLDLPLSFADWEFEMPNSTTGALDEASALATAMLLASLQELLRLERHAFEFEYRLSDGPPAT